VLWEFGGRFYSWINYWNETAHDTLRRRVYTNAKEDYWTRQLEYAKEREVNVIQIKRLENIVSYLIVFIMD
jgi:hypothetical protein